MLSLQLKLLILGVIVVGDLIAAALVVPKLMRQGEPARAFILGVAMFASIVATAAALFLIL